MLCNSYSQRVPRDGHEKGKVAARATVKRVHFHFLADVTLPYYRVQSRAAQRKVRGNTVRSLRLAGDEGLTTLGSY